MRQTVFLLTITLLLLNASLLLGGCDKENEENTGCTFEIKYGETQRHVVNGQKFAVTVKDITVKGNPDDDYLRYNSYFLLYTIEVNSRLLEIDSGSPVQKLPDTAFYILIGRSTSSYDPARKTLRPKEEHVLIVTIGDTIPYNECATSSPEPPWWMLE